MNVLFLTLVEINSVEERGLYQDLLRKFRDEGHNLTVMTPVQRHRGIGTNLRSENGISVLQVRTFNIQKTNILEKGLGTLAIEYQYMRAYKRFLSKEAFDMVVYTTPPITLTKVIAYVKKRCNAFSYLLLKDIFPQNAVDIGLLKKGGLLYGYFRKKEEKLYDISDKIGCMSPANADYVINNNPEVSISKVEVNPNSIEANYLNLSYDDKVSLRKRYGLPVDKRIFVYGGNLGKPQGLDFLLETIKAVHEPGAYFLVVGDGTEYNRISQWFQNYNPKNAKLMTSLLKPDYDLLLAACDIGLIFLDSKFTIPNFPSRLLSYLEMQMPVIAATDSATDIGDIIEDKGCGYKVLAGDIKKMTNTVSLMLQKDLKLYEIPCRSLLEDEYHVRYTYQKIVEGELNHHHKMDVSRKLKP